MVKEWFKDNHLYINVAIIVVIRLYLTIYGTMNDLLPIYTDQLYLIYISHNIFIIVVVFTFILPDRKHIEQAIYIWIYISLLFAIYDLLMNVYQTNLDYISRVNHFFIIIVLIYRGIL